MDNNLFLFGSFFAVIDLFVIIYFIKKQNPAFFIALHLLAFWAFIIFFNLISMTSNDFGFNIFEFLFINVLLLTYIVLFPIIYLRFNWKFLNNKRFIEYLINVETRIISILLTAWVVFKFYLIFKYGIYSFFLLWFREEMQIPYWEVALNSLLLYPALGAFFVLLAKAVYRIKFLFNPFVLIPALFFFLFTVIFNEIAGSRRFVVFLGFWIVLVYLYKTKLKFNLKLIVFLILFGGLSLAFAQYFQLIRENTFDPNIQTLLYSDAPGDVLLAIQTILTEPNKYYASTEENLQTRFSPFIVLYSINHSQFTTFTFTYGKLLKQSVENVLPAILVPGKEYINADDIICETYHYPKDDLPSGVLASLQSDFFLFGFFIAPFIYFWFFYFYNFMINKYYTKSKFIVLTSFAMLIFTSLYTESLIDSMLVNIRDFATLLFIYFVIVSSKRVFINFKNSLAYS